MPGADVLEEVAFRVIKAASAAVALRALEVDPRAIAVLVTDVHMPGSRDGEDLARIVANRRKFLGRAAVSGPSLPPRSVARMLRRFSFKRGSPCRHDGPEAGAVQLEPTKVNPRSPAQVDGILAWGASDAIDTAGPQH
jgi:hypothetical protein